MIPVKENYAVFPKNPPEITAMHNNSKYNNQYSKKNSLYNGDPLQFSAKITLLPCIPPKKASNASHIPF